MALPSSAPSPATTPSPSVRAGRLALAARTTDYWATLVRRTWRGSVTTAFVTPLLYVAAMGYFLGGYVDASSASLGGAPSYLAYICPGLLAGQAMLLSMGDMTWPVFGRITWDKTYLAMLATPLRVGDVALAQILATVTTTGLACAVFMVPLAFVGVYASPGGALAALAIQFLLAAAFATPVLALTAGLRGDAAFSVLYRLVQVPMYLFSGAFFPVENLPEVIRWIAVATPLFHGVELTRMAMLDTWTSAAFGHVAYLLLLAGVGAVVAVRRLTRRLVR